MKKVLSECSLLGVPVLIDCAYYGIASGVDFDLSKYDCIKEGNPLLGDRPTVPHMITHKYVFLSPIWMLQNEGVYTKREINLYNSMAGIVVYNNLRLLDEAKTKCSKR